MKLSSCVGFEEAFKTIMGEKVDFKLAYRLTKILKKLEGELESFREAQKVILIKYGKKEKDGRMRLQPDKLEDFNKDLNELLNSEVDVEFEPIPMEKIEAMGAITPQVMLQLSEFVEEEKSKAK